MRYCPDCGTPHECSAEIAADRTELAIAKVQAERDIKLAEIGARAGVKIAETEAEHDASRAEGEAAGMETAIEALTGNADEGEPVGEPIVVEAAADDDAEAEAEVEDDVTPPVVVPEPAAPRPSGWWDGYAASRR